MSKEDIEELKKLYYSKKVGLTSFDKLWRKVKKEGLGLTQKEVKAFFKQKTAYEIMSGDWSSDVCSSD
eukprot:COSAG02_NODE_20630_length_822_cov_0.786999_2_plen_67_part_01